MTDYLGWSATAVFVGSYFCGRANAIRRVQMAGALLWILYGVLIDAYPVVVANLLVFGAAAWTMRHRNSDATRPQHAPGTSGSDTSTSSLIAQPRS